MKYVYIVHGSQDGAIGAYTNKKTAIKHAESYVGGDQVIEDKGWIVFVGDHLTGARVEQMTVNEYDWN